jgi:TonB-linked SusC/RagA family outer membrane protein
MRKLFALILFFLTASLPVFSQSTAVKGKLLDEFGHALKGAEIRVKNSSATTVSGDAGEFEIAASTGGLLVISYPNYKSAEARISNLSTPLIIRLSRSFLPKADKLDVLYENRDANKVLGAVSTIYTSQLNTTPAPLYAYALAGRLPGLYTQQNRGWAATNTSPLVQQDVDGLYYPQSSTKGLKGPNDNTEISLRLRGQAPVTIIDGVQRDIYTIDPENIESVSVLKDALSTILLGQRSSRGVVLVTTKKPLSGTPHVSLTAQTGIQTPLNLPSPISAYEYAYLYNEAQSNQGNALSYTYNDFQAFRNKTDPYGHPDVNWFNTILKENSMMSRYSLNVSGGGSSARYSVGLGYLSQEGLFNGSNPNYETNATLKRYSINTNIDIDVTKEFKTKLQLYARVQDGNQPGGTTDGIITQMYTTPGNAYPVFNPNGSFGGTQAFSNNLYARLTNSGYIEDYTRDILANLELNYNFDRFLKGLWAKAQTNLSVYSSNSTTRSASVPSFKLSIGTAGDSIYSRYGSIGDQTNNFNLTYSAQYWYFQTALGYTNSFGKHNINAKLFYDRYESIYNYDLPETVQNNAITSSYNYDQKYFVEAAANYSGNDRYPPGHHFGLFYAFGLGWNIAEEAFIKDNSSLKWINNLKLRATYGKTGNDNVGYFGWRESFQLNIVNPTYPISITRSSQGVAQQNILANPNVTWEKGNKFNVGLDVSLFNNHVQLTTDYYNDRYSDLLQLRGRQGSLVGLPFPLENLGINRYSGTELSATYQSNYRNLHYFITANGTFEKTKVIYSNEIRQNYDWNYRTGQPVGMTFGYVSEGLIQTQQEAQTSATIAGYTLQPGDIKYKDLNADGTINQYDQTAIGQGKPLFYYGVNGGFSIKGFDVNVLLQGVANRTYVFNRSAFGLFGTDQAYTYAIGRWTPETAATATYPRLTPGTNINNDVASTFWLKSGNYFRIKNAEIGYTLPVKVAGRFKVSSVRFFSNGLNLFTKAAYNEVDPEVNGAVYPIQRIVNFGLNVKF